MVSLSNVTLSFGGFTLFQNISFLINPIEKVGLVGKNGAGKTTLLKIIIGELSPSEGYVSKPTDIKIGYLPQHIHYTDSKTVIEDTLTAFSEINDLQKKIEQLNEAFEHRTDYDSDEYLKLIHTHTEATDRFQILGGVNIRAEAEQALLGLGFPHSDFDRLTSEFSGGWRMRIELAKVLLRKPDIFLFDEPTNHLDIESIQWFEDFLTAYKGAALIISHDKAFLDNVTNRTIEISLGKAYDYRVPYSKYVVLRKEQREQQMATYLNQQKMIEDTERFIERFRSKATKAVQVQSRVKQLAKVERIVVEEEDKSAMHFRFPTAPRSGTIAMEAEDMSKRYGNLLVLDNVKIIVERGEKIAFVGRNGEGKSTMLKVITGELSFEGTVKIGHNVKLGYYAQNQPDLLDLNKTVLQTIDDVAVGEIRTRIRDILGSFLFSGEDCDKKVKVLSGGERSRLSLAKMLLEPVNLLILDEPTNHLDMKSKEILKNALLKYDGTLILVSHDRDFLDGLVTKVYEFTNKKIKQHIGGIYDFLRKKKLSNLKDIEKKDQLAKDLLAGRQGNAEEKISNNKIQYIERKEQEREIRKVKNQISKLEEQISIHENELKNLADILSEPDKLPAGMDFNAVYLNHERIKKEISSKELQWERLHYEADILESKKI